jgi:2-methylcitrate dehydratase PrpD
MGAAAACGKLLGLNEQQMVWALGIAATQSSGLREMFGTMCKPFHPGNAAKNGLMSALLAEKNFTSSNRGIEAPRGFAHVLSTKFDPSEIIDGLGSTFEIDLNTYKPFACGIVIHPIIDACVQLRNEHKLTGDEIESVLAKVHPLVLELTGKKTPQTGLEGKFSVYHSAAAGFIYGAAGEREYSDAVVRDTKVVALRDKVTAVVDSTMHEDQTLVEVRLKDGRTLSKYVEAAIGSLKRPQTDADLEAKFRGLAEDVLPKAQVDKVLGLAWKVGALASAGDVAAAARK